MGGGNPPIFPFFPHFLSLFVHYFLENVTREPPITPKGGILQSPQTRSNGVFGELVFLGHDHQVVSPLSWASRNGEAHEFVARSSLVDLVEIFYFLVFVFWGFSRPRGRKTRKN